MLGMIGMIEFASTILIISFSTKADKDALELSRVPSNIDIWRQERAKFFMSYAYNACVLAYVLES